MVTVAHLLALVLVLHSILIINAETVEISSGKIEGVSLVSRNGREYFAFLGIPYGVVKRFQIAVKPQSWNDTKKMDKYGAACVQFDVIRKEIVGKEQCLFLNVYMPVSSPQEKMPVMVWLHGGGFNFGSAALYKAKYFMDQKIVLVTLNYRLGVFGFLDPQDEEVPANLGLKDQQLAFEWVQTNIPAFNGDRELVTLFGSSAGGASVGLHMLHAASSNSKVIFHRAISQSGTALSTWLIQRHPRENAKKLARFANCSSPTTRKMMNCLKHKTAKEIINAELKFMLGTSLSDINYLFTPSVEKSAVGNAFLTGCPLDLVKKITYSQIPWMMGSSENDGIFNTGKFLEKDDIVDEVMRNWTEIAPWLFVYNFDAKKKERDEISKIIQANFLLDENGKFKKEKFSSIIPVMVGDRWENFGIYESIRLLGFKARIYAYRFSFYGNFSFTNFFFGLKEPHGVGHLDELQYLFDGVYGAPIYVEEDEIKNFSEKLVELFVEFAKTGIPRTNHFTGWKHSDAHSIQLYEINRHSKMIPLSKDFKNNMDFWRNAPPPSCQLLKNDHEEL